MSDSRATSNEQLRAILSRLRASTEDRDAWAELYVLLWPFVLASAYRLVRADRDLSEDVAQNVFERILSHSHRFEFEDEQLFRRQVWSECRRQARTALRPRSGLLSASFEDDAHLGADSSTDELARVNSLQRHLCSGLDARESELLDLLIADRSLPDIARLLGVSYSAAGARVHRLREKIRNLL